MTEIMKEIISTHTERFKRAVLGMHIGKTPDNEDMIRASIHKHPFDGELCFFYDDTCIGSVNTQFVWDTATFSNRLVITLTPIQ